MIIIKELMDFIIEQTPIICAIIEIKDLYDGPTTEFKHSLGQPLTDATIYSTIGWLILVAIRRII